MSDDVFNRILVPLCSFRGAIRRHQRVTACLGGSFLSQSASSISRRVTCVTRACIFVYISVTIWNFLVKISVIIVFELLFPLKLSEL